MSPSERIREAKGLYVLASELLSRGLDSAAGEMLWGAVNHVIAAIVDHHRLQKDGKPMTRKQAMEHLQETAPRDPALEDSLSVVGQLHGHFYNKHMTLMGHSAAMKASGELVTYLLARPEVQDIL